MLLLFFTSVERPYVWIVVTLWRFDFFLICWYISLHFIISNNEWRKKSALSLIRFPTFFKEITSSASFTCTSEEFQRRKAFFEFISLYSPSPPRPLVQIKPISLFLPRLKWRMNRSLEMSFDKCCSIFFLVFKRRRSNFFQICKRMSANASYVLRDVWESVRVPVQFLGIGPPYREPSGLERGVLKLGARVLVRCVRTFLRLGYVLWLIYRMFSLLLLFVCFSIVLHQCNAHITGAFCKFSHSTLIVSGFLILAIFGYYKTRSTCGFFRLVVHQTVWVSGGFMRLWLFFYWQLGTH